VNAPEVSACEMCGATRDGVIPVLDDPFPGLPSTRQARVKFAAYVHVSVRVCSCGRSLTRSCGVEGCEPSAEEPGQGSAGAVVACHW